MSVPSQNYFFKASIPASRELIEWDNQIKKEASRLDTRETSSSKKPNPSIAMSNIQIETDLAEILKEIKSDQKTMLEEMRSGQKEILKKVNALEVSLETVKGDIKAMDERLSGQIKALDTKVEQLDKRVGNQEFTNRGILIGLIVVILGGAAKFFGIVGNP
ncbi:hypothetical protein [Stanieria cyanosphaera]|nr:hypothetical protein [Stanieria cyanosphaera]